VINITKANPVMKNKSPQELKNYRIHLCWTRFGHGGIRSDFGGTGFQPVLWPDASCGIGGVAGLPDLVFDFGGTGFQPVQLEVRGNNCRGGFKTRPYVFNGKVERHYKGGSRTAPTVSLPGALAVGLTKAQAGKPVPLRSSSACATKNH